MIPVPATAPSNNSYTNVAFDGAAAAKGSRPVSASPDTSNDINTSVSNNRILLRPPPLQLQSTMLITDT